MFMCGQNAVKWRESRRIRSGWDSEPADNKMRDMEEQSYVS